MKWKRYLCHLLAFFYLTFFLFDRLDASKNDVDQRIRQVIELSSDINNVDYSLEGNTLVLSGFALTFDAEQNIKKKLLEIDGIDFVDSRIKQTFDFKARLSPVMERIQNSIYDILALLPILGIAVILIIVGWIIAKFVSNRKKIFGKITKNLFLQDILRQSAKMVIIILSVVSALELIGATSIIGAVLGAAGVLGLAISFAFRDIMENYIAGILLSLRQPFSSGDHIKIGDFEGLVIRMTTRATMIKSFDGNNIEMPNSSVFKQTIINYNIIPERRFDFSIGIDAEADPDIGRRVGIQAIKEIEGVLNSPKVSSTTDNIGDSSIILSFFGWVNQDSHDYFQVRSGAIRAAKNAIEATGISIPEPMYGVRFLDSVIPPSGEHLNEMKKKSHLSIGQIEPRKALEKETSLDNKKSIEIEQLIAKEKRSEFGKGDLLEN